jgi:chaperone LolA
MKIRTIITLISLFIFTNIVSAQHKEAEAILKELSEKTNSFNNIKISFAYKMLNKEAGIDETTNGTLLVSGNKYHLNIAGQEIISDGTTIWTYLADSEEVQVNEVMEDEGFSPNKLLSSYNEDYTAKKEKDITKEGKKLYELKLKPKEKASNFNYVTLVIDAEKMQLESFIMHDFDGNIFSYDLKQFITNSNIPESSFTFDTSKYPNVEVIDMR